MIKDIVVVKVIEGCYNLLIRGTVVGQLVNLTDVKSTANELDGLIVSKSKAKDIIHGLTMTDFGKEFIKAGKNTASFTKRIMGQLGLSNEVYSSRFFRGFFEDRHGYIYDASNRLIIGYTVNNIPQGVICDYAHATSARLEKLLGENCKVKKYRGGRRR